jgi:hypothetical protein
MCVRCREKAAGTASATPQPKVETKSGVHRGWNLRNLVPRKKNQEEVARKAKIEFTVIEASKPRRSMWVPPSRKEIIPQKTKIPQAVVHPSIEITPPSLKDIIQLTSINPQVEVHPLKASPIEYPLRQDQIQRKPLSIINRVERSVQEPFLDDRPSTPKAAAKAEKETQQILDHDLSARPEHHNTVAAFPNAELCWEILETAGKAAKDARQLLPSQQKYMPYRPAIRTSEYAETQQNPSSKARNPGRSELTELIPELQRDAPNRPPIDTDKLDKYLKKIATRPRTHRPYRPSDIQDDDEILFERHQQRYTTVRQEKAAVLQHAEFAPSAERSIQGMPSCLIPGPPKELTRTPQTEFVPSLECSIEGIPSCLIAGPKKQLTREPQILRRKKSFDLMASAQILAQFETRPQKQELEKPVYKAYNPLATSIRPQTATPAPLDLDECKKVRTASSKPSQYHTKSRAGPGWEVFSPFTPVTPAPLVIRKEKSPPGALNAASRYIANASTLVPRQAPRIPSLQKFPSLEF